MSVEESDTDLIIKIPNFSPIKIPKSSILKMEEVDPPEEICRLFMSKPGLIFAGSTIDGKISYFNIKPGEKCIRIILKDGRQIYITHNINK
ncbi:hypothetical protein DFR86_01375 [Acidianus sulfidivorans JP7]|uniref:Uncharacterized protein n=1 Tax=Acidianus sulfidivorans JP7 TaxID=619593 RepID=A0A2U9IJV8_9CREN|nr:hypothetical protein [Acidianus sulfidivorans]AWR96327.1 hypothetical protein DFR86_01375 [Acidianus sulfidivorans JP7]